MPDFLTPLSPEYSIEIPEDPLALLILAGWSVLVLIGLILTRNRRISLDREALSWLAILSALVLALTPFLGVKLYPDMVEQTASAPVNHFMFLAAVPWMVGVGVLGILPAGLIAGISGLLLAYLDTHQLTTPLLFMTVTLIFSQVLRRGQMDKAHILQLPLASAVISWLVSTPVVFVFWLVSAHGSLGLRSAQAMEGFRAAFLTLGGMLLLGGLTATLVRRAFPRSWKADQQEGLAQTTQKATRLLELFGVLFFVLITLIFRGVWRVSENTARRMLVAQLTNSAGAAADGLEIFYEIGKDQLYALSADSRLRGEDVDGVTQALIEETTSTPFFHHLGLFDLEGNLISSHPELEQGFPALTSEETLTVSTVAGETMPALLAAAPKQDTAAAQVLFIQGIQNPEGQTVRVLVGRTSLGDSLIGAKMLESLGGLEAMGGVAQVIDEQGQRVYHTDPGRRLTAYSNQRSSTATFFESVTADNRPMMMYYQPVHRTGLAVVTAFPAEVRQLLTWEIAAPLVLAGGISSLLLLLVLFLVVSPQINELDRIKSGIKAVMAAHPPAGETSEKLHTQNYEAVFSQTLASLNRRIQQQRDLLAVYDFQNNPHDLNAGLTPVMKAALAQGAAAVRVILRQASTGAGRVQRQGPFGMGRDTRQYAALDSQVASLLRTEGLLDLRGMQVRELFTFPEGLPYPSSLIAVPLKLHEEWLGFLWAVYPERREPGQDAVDFFKLLANRTAQILKSYLSMAELELRQAQLKKALDILPQAVLLVDAQEKILYHNDRFIALIGSNESDLVGKDLLRCLERSQHPQRSRAILEGEPQGEIRLENGGRLKFKREMIQINGAPHGMVMVFEAQDGFSTKLGSDTELVTVVSHALRSPLTLIHGYAKILRLTGNLNDQQDDYISKIINGVEETRGLVQNLLEVGRLEAHGVMELSEFQADQVLNKIEDSMAAQFRQKNIQLTVKLPEEPITLRADFTLLTQAVKNLVENALKFTKMGGKVTLDAREREGRVIFSVQDTGPGIAPLDQRDLFEKFQRGRELSGKETSGSGLGLAIVRAIVEHHQGRVWVESQLGKGSTFFIEIPKQPA